MEKLLPDISANSIGSAVAAKDYGPYPAYRDSEVEWLGDIPAHWGLKRLRFTVIKCQNGLWGDEPDGESDVVCVRVADFDRVAYRVKVEHLTLRSVRRSILRTHGLNSGDLLLEKSGGGENQPVGTVVLNTYGENAVCSNFIARMPVKEGFDSRYLTYVHAVLYAARVNSRSIKQNTGIQNLDSQSYLNEVIAVPDLQEQCVISTYLDGETAKIDALGAKKERLIELLQEKRTAIVTRAVTKGIDPDAPMKDSGVEWLGEIPSHWSVSKLKSMVPKVTVGIVVTPSKYYVEDGIPCLRSLNIAQGSVTTDNLVSISESANALHRKSQIFAGDIVVVRTGRAGTAVVVPPEFDGANCVDLLIIRQSNRLHSRFLYYFMNSGTVRGQVVAESVGSIQEHYNTSTLANLVTPKIPIQEQRSIAGYLDLRTARIDALVAKVHEAIDRLKELRTALIAAAVTGKIDVRETPM